MESSNLAGRYRGATAAHYDQHRVGEPVWAREQAIVSSMLEVFPRPGTLIDVPVGTGRFFELYRARGLRPTGVDVSADMLGQARQKAAQVGLLATLEEGDIRQLRFPNGAFDGAVCIRLFNLIRWSDAVQAVEELARVSRHHVIVGVRSFLPLRELLRRPGRTRVIAHRLARHARRVASSQVLKVHPRAAVLEAFAESSLVIVRAVPVERFADGSELVVYLLQKDPYQHRSAGR